MATHDNADSTTTEDRTSPAGGADEGGAAKTVAESSTADTDTSTSPKKGTKKAAAAKPASTKTATKKAARKSTTKKAARTSTTKKASAKADQQGAGSASGGTDAAPTSDSPAPGATAAEPPEPSGAPAAPPSFGVTFQAPDPVAVRGTSERASAVDDDRGAEPDAESDDDDQPRRRRRGGRGRRGRGGPETDGQADSEAARPDTSDGDAGRRDADRDDAARSDTGGDESPKREPGRKKKGRQGTTDKGSGKDKKDSSKAKQGSREDGDAEDADQDRGDSTAGGDDSEGSSSSSRRRRRRRRGGSGSSGSDDPPGTVTKVREPRADRDEPTGVKGSTRLEAKKQRRREGREAGRRRTIITEAEFLARRESVERVMVVRSTGDRTQIGVLEDGVLVEHYVSRETNGSLAGNVYLGRVQNVLPSMEAAFVDIGKGRNAVLYAGEVNWDAAGLEQNQPKRIENALTSGDSVLVQVTKDPIGHKGARLTSQISLPGRYLVYVPEGNMTGISRKLPDTERARLKQILKEVVPDSAGVIVRTAAEGASEEELRKDVERLTKAWQSIQDKAAGRMEKKASAGGAPTLLNAEPDLTVRVIRDVFNEDFSSIVVSGDEAWDDVSGYLGEVAPDLTDRLTRWTDEEDVFAHYRVDEQLAKAMDRKVWLPSGGSLVIDRTEAMTVIDVNTGKFVGSGGNLEETVTKNNIEAAEEIVRQLRLRDIGGIIVIDFIDMVLESNRELVVRRLLECLGRDRTKHQVAEVTSLGLVQMTRKRVGSGLIEVFSEPCEHCNGRGIIIHSEPVDRAGSDQGGSGSRSKGRRRGGSGKSGGQGSGNGSRAESPHPGQDGEAARTGPTAAQIAAAAHAAAVKGMAGEASEDDVADLASTDTSAAEDSTASVEAETVDAAEDAGENVPTGGTTTGQSGSGQSASGGSAAHEPTTARRRRKRGRVTAPAGPPPQASSSGPADPPHSAGTPDTEDGTDGDVAAPPSAPASAPESSTSTASEPV